MRIALGNKSQRRKSRASQCCICADPCVAEFRGFSWCGFHLERVQAIVAAAEAPPEPVQRRAKPRRAPTTPHAQRRAKILALLAQYPAGLSSRELVHRLRTSLKTAGHDLRKLRLLGKVRSFPQPRELGHRGRHRWLWSLPKAKAS